MSVKLKLITNLPNLESAIRKDFPTYSLSKNGYFGHGAFSLVKKVIDKKKHETVAVVKIPRVYISPLDHAKQDLENIIEHLKKDAKTCKALEKTNRVAKIYGIYPMEVAIDKQALSDIDIVKDITRIFTSERWGKKIPAREVIVDNLMKMLKDLKMLLTKTFKVFVPLKEFIKGFCVKEAKRKKIITKEDFVSEFIDLLRTLRSYGIALVDNMAGNCMIDINDNNRLKLVELGGCYKLSLDENMGKNEGEQKIRIQQIRHMYRAAWGEEPDNETENQIRDNLN